MGSATSSSSFGERPPSDADPELVAKARRRPQEMSNREWRSVLGETAYRVARAHGTEPAFTGELLDNKGEGVYLCTCCQAELFSSATKYDSGSGWPSFYDTMKKARGIIIMSLLAN